MRILFEALLKNPSFIDTMSMEHTIALNGMFDYIEGRLMPLRDEMELIEKEEDEGDPAKCSFVMIHFPNPGITYKGYTQELRDKMQECFTQIDVEPMWANIMQSVRTFLN